MEPLSDRELDELLKRWEAPAAPEALRKRVRQAQRGSWWKWLLTGSIRVPVPLTLAIAALLIGLFVMVTKRGPRGDVQVRPETSAAGFQPVKRLEPRIIRSSYEGNY
ncbi:MAG TPA: hypothetical protein VGE93_16990 [Bryobacteraceae bacterium]